MPRLSGTCCPLGAHPAPKRTSRRLDCTRGLSGGEGSQMRSFPVGIPRFPLRLPQRPRFARTFHGGWHTNPLPFWGARPEPRARGSTRPRSSPSISSLKASIQPLPDTGFPPCHFSGQVAQKIQAVSIYTARLGEGGEQTDLPPRCRSATERWAGGGPAVGAVSTPACPPGENDVDMCSGGPVRPSKKLSPESARAEAAASV